MKKFNIKLSKGIQTLMLVSFCAAILLAYVSYWQTSYLTVSEAQKELTVFKELVNKNSSYLQFNAQNFNRAFEQVEMQFKEEKNISRAALARKFGMLLGEIGDRHISVRTAEEDNKEQTYYLPFIIAPWQGKHVLALQEKSSGEYTFFLSKYPVLSSVAGVDVTEWMTLVNYENKHAPKYARHARGVNQLFEVEKLKELFSVDMEKGLKFTFSSLHTTQDTTLYLKLSKDGDDWEDRGGQGKIFKRALRNNQYDQLFKVFPGDVAYLALPKMVSQQEDPDFFKWLSGKMDSIHFSKALILDIRDNSGGNRDILRFLAPYFVPPGTQSWVANLAKIRVDTVLNNDIPEMMERGLFVYSSTHLSLKKREAIDVFKKNFVPARQYDENKFSQYYYMVISQRDNLSAYYYSSPVFILMNEGSFSAASVFAGSLKGLGQVKLIGTSTDGSSGLAKEYKLNNSAIHISFSHMISFQRSGKLFDGSGTDPDIRIEKSMNQLLGKEDHQLGTLLNIIGSK